MSERDLLHLTADLVVAYVARHAVSPAEIAGLVESIHAALDPVGGTLDEPRVPAVPIGQSVTRDHIVCLEDGERLRTLKRHLRAQHNLTPDGYRIRWNLSPAYPMVAPSYAEQRSRRARRWGLGGRKGRPHRA